MVIWEISGVIFPSAEHEHWTSLSAKPKNRPKEQTRNPQRNKKSAYDSSTFLKSLATSSYILIYVNVIQSTCAYKWYTLNQWTRKHCIIWSSSAFLILFEIDKTVVLCCRAEEPEVWSPIDVHSITRVFLIMGETMSL